jgi:protein-disulfide isomerase
VLLSFGVASSSFAQELFKLEGKSYTPKELTPAQQQALFELENEHYQRLKGMLDNVAVESVLDAEAKKKNKPREEIEKKMFEAKDPSDKEIKEWYEQNKSRIPPSYTFDQIKGDIKKLIQGERAKTKRDEFIAKMGKSHNYAVQLKKPEAPVVSVDTAGFPSKGSDSAKVTIVEFADYQCPHCAEASNIMKKVTDKYKDKVRLVYIDFPINPSGISKVVAEGSHCAGEQGKYWDYHYKAFQGQTSLDKESHTKLAKELKLDEAKFKACVDGGKGKQLVEKGRAEGEKIGVSGTPFILINGQRYLGQHTFDAVKAEIDSRLK